MAQSEGPTPDTTPRRREGRERERERRKDGMTRESWVEFMQSHSV